MTTYLKALNEMTNPYKNVVCENWVRIKGKDPNNSQMKELYQ